MKCLNKKINLKNNTYEKDLRKNITTEILKITIIDICNIILIVLLFNIMY